MADRIGARRATGRTSSLPISAATGRVRRGERYRFRDFLDDLNPGWDLVIGHSLGGTLAAQALADDPGFARRAVLLDPVLELPDGEFETILAGQLAERTLTEADLAAANPRWHPEDIRRKLEASRRVRCPRQSRRCCATTVRGIMRTCSPLDSEILGGDPAHGALFTPHRPPALPRGCPAPGTRRIATTRTPSSRRWMPVSKGESIDLERTRGKVLKAATELFYRDGTHAGINELTERAGISKLTLYRHFGSKEGLLEEVLRQRSDRVVGVAEGRRRRARGPGRARARRLRRAARLVRRAGLPRLRDRQRRDREPEQPRRARSRACTSAATASC